jgi:hypothetical protein
MRKRRTRGVDQPDPRNPGVTQEMVKEHACRLYRDLFPQQPLTMREWRLVEEDLVRKLERDGF